MVIMELGKLKRYLPATFCGIIPLQSGMELILLYNAINKMSGLFGLLSLFTNHPINFVQWTYYVINIILIIITGFTFVQLKRLSNQVLSNESLNTEANLISVKILALFVVSYIVDFFIGNAFMVYLTNLWFEEEYSATNSSTTGKPGTKLSKRVSTILSKQSASESYEIFVSVFTIIISEIARIYFMTIVVSYYLRLRKRISRTCMGHGARIVDFLDKFN